MVTGAQKLENSNREDDKNLCAKLLSQLPLHLLTVFEPVFDKNKDFAKTLSLITFYDIFEHFKTSEYHKPVEDIRADSAGGYIGEGSHTAFTVPHLGVSYKDISGLANYMSEDRFIRELKNHPETVDIIKQEGGQDLYSANLVTINKYLCVIIEQVVKALSAPSIKASGTIEGKV